MIIETLFFIVIFSLGVAFGGAAVLLGYRFDIINDDDEEGK